MALVVAVSGPAAHPGGNMEGLRLIWRFRRLLCIYPGVLIVFPTFSNRFFPCVCAHVTAYLFALVFHLPLPPYVSVLEANLEASRLGTEETSERQLVCTVTFVRKLS